MSHPGRAAPPGTPLLQPTAPTDGIRHRAHLPPSLAAPRRAIPSFPGADQRVPALAKRLGARPAARPRGREGCEGLLLRPSSRGSEGLSPARSPALRGVAALQLRRGRRQGRTRATGTITPFSSQRDPAPATERRTQERLPTQRGMCRPRPPVSPGSGPATARVPPRARLPGQPDAPDRSLAPPGAAKPRPLPGSFHPSGEPPPPAGSRLPGIGQAGGFPGTGAKQRRQKTRESRLSRLKPYPLALMVDPSRLLGILGVEVRRRVRRCLPAAPAPSLASDALLIALAAARDNPPAAGLQRHGATRGGSAAVRLFASGGSRGGGTVPAFFGCWPRRPLARPSPETPRPTCMPQRPLVRAGRQGLPCTSRWNEEGTAEHVGEGAYRNLPKASLEKPPSD